MRSIEMSDTRPLEDILEAAEHEMDGRDGSVSDLLDIYDDRAFGPIFSLLGLLVVLPPLGAIPGLPMVVGVMIILLPNCYWAATTRGYLVSLSACRFRARKFQRRARSLAKPSRRLII